MKYINANNIEKNGLYLHDVLLNDIKIQYQKKRNILFFSVTSRASPKKARRERCFGH